MAVVYSPPPPDRSRRRPPSLLPPFPSSDHHPIISHPPLRSPHILPALFLRPPSAAPPFVVVEVQRSSFPTHPLLFFSTDYPRSPLLFSEVCYQKTMKIRQKRLSDYAAEGDSSVFGTVEFLIEDEDDLYAVYRLICRNDICKIENNRQFNYDIHAEHCTFDTFLLTIKGKVSTGDKNTRPGSYRTLPVVKNTLLSVNKKTCDFFETLFLESARLTERTLVRPIVIVSLRKEGGEIHLIGDGWTHEVISIQDEDEMKVFDRLLLRFNSKIDITWVAYVFIAGDGEYRENSTITFMETLPKIS